GQRKRREQSNRGQSECDRDAGFNQHIAEEIVAVDLAALAPLRLGGGGLGRFAFGHGREASASRIALRRRNNMERRGPRRRYGASASNAGSGLSEVAGEDAGAPYLTPTTSRVSPGSSPLSPAPRSRRTRSLRRAPCRSLADRAGALGCPWRRAMRAPA